MPPVRGPARTVSSTRVAAAAQGMNAAATPTPASRTLWILAGESSGDLYGARLAAELRRLDPQLAVRGMGGAAMREAGVDLLVDSSELGVVGLVEVLRHLRTFLRIFADLVARAARERPAAVVLIDYPGFNLRFARRMHDLGIPVVYYVSPQVWAWGRRRIPTIARLVRKMIVLFPFETETYAGTGLDVEFAGHPLVDLLTERRDPALVRTSDTLLLLPGSRHSELDRLLHPLLDTAAWLAARRPDLRFVLAAASPAMAARVRRELERRATRHPTMPPVQIVVGETHAWMQRAAAGLAASGTVTMESAILGLPLVVVYRVNPFTYAVGRRLVKLPFFTIVNLVAGRCVFQEFLQGQVCPAVLGPALETILPGGSRRADVEAGMHEAVVALGGARNASRRAAEAVLSVLAATAPPVTPT